MRKERSATADATLTSFYSFKARGLDRDQGTMDFDFRCYTYPNKRSLWESATGVVQSWVSEPAMKAMGESN